MPETYIPIERIAAAFNLQPHNIVQVDSHVFRCLWWVAQQDTTHDAEGVGAAMQELAKDARDKKGGYNCRGLALALAMNGEETEDQVFARLNEVAAKVYPAMQREKAFTQRRALVGLSAADQVFANAHEERIAQRNADNFHVLALTAHVEAHRRKHNLDFESAFNAVMSGGKLTALNASADC